MVLAGLGTSGWAAAAVLGAGQAFHGFGIGFSNSHEMSYRQALTPDALQARTNTTMRSFNRAVVVVVAPLGGLLAVQAGNRTALRRRRGHFAVASRCWPRHRSEACGAPARVVVSGVRGGV